MDKLNELHNRLDQQKIKYRKNNMFHLFGTLVYISPNLAINLDLYKHYKKKWKYLGLVIMFLFNCENKL